MVSAFATDFSCIVVLSINLEVSSSSWRAADILRITLSTVNRFFVFVLVKLSIVVRTVGNIGGESTKP